MSKERIDAPGPSTGYRQKEENEAVKYSQLSLVERWHEEVALPRVHQEIGYCHLSAQNESRASRKQAECDEQSADQFNGPGQSVKLREIVIDSAAGKSPQFLCSVLHEEQPSDDPQNTQ